MDDLQLLYSEMYISDIASAIRLITSDENLYNIEEMHEKLINYTGNKISFVKQIIKDVRKRLLTSNLDPSKMDLWDGETIGCAYFNNGSYGLIIFPDKDRGLSLCGVKFSRDSIIDKSGLYIGLSNSANCLMFRNANDRLNGVRDYYIRSVYDNNRSNYSKSYINESSDLFVKDGILTNEATSIYGIGFDQSHPIFNEKIKNGVPFSFNDQILNLTVGDLIKDSSYKFYMQPVGVDIVDSKINILYNTDNYINVDEDGNCFRLNKSIGSVYVSSFVNDYVTLPSRLINSEDIDDPDMIYANSYDIMNMNGEVILESNTSLRDFNIPENLHINGLLKEIDSVDPEVNDHYTTVNNDGNFAIITVVKNLESQDPQTPIISTDGFYRLVFENTDLNTNGSTVQVTILNMQGGETIHVYYGDEMLGDGYDVRTSIVWLGDIGSSLEYMTSNIDPYSSTMPILDDERYLLMSVAGNGSYNEDGMCYNSIATEQQHSSLENFEIRSIIGSKNDQNTQIRVFSISNGTGCNNMCSASGNGSVTDILLFRY